MFHKFSELCQANSTAANLTTDEEFTGDTRLCAVYPVWL